MDFRQSKEYGTYMESQGWKVVKCGMKGSKKKMSVFVKKLPLVPWSVMKAQRFDGKILWRVWEEIRREYRVIYCIMEPGSFDVIEEDEYRKRRYWKSSVPFAPSTTLVVNLKKKEGELWMNLSKDARQRIKKASGLKIVQLEEKDLGKFVALWKKWGKGYVFSLKKVNELKRSFGKSCQVMGVQQGGELVGGSVVLMVDRTAYYYFAWTSEKGRESDAQYFFVWELMRKAKKMGCKFWDFEGLNDRRSPRKSWEGFSMFKRKFGGEEIVYPGCFERWL